MAKNMPTIVSWEPFLLVDLYTNAKYEDNLRFYLGISQSISRHSLTLQDQINVVSLGNVGDLRIKCDKYQGCLFLFRCLRLLWRCLFIWFLYSACWFSTRHCSSLLIHQTLMESVYHEIYPVSTLVHLNGKICTKPNLYPIIKHQAQPRGTKVSYSYKRGMKFEGVVKCCRSPEIQ